MKDLVNVFAERFETVALIAGHVSKTGNKLNPAVEISKITRYKKGSTTGRLFSWIWATIQTILLVCFKYRGYHLLITSNPPTLAFLPVFCRNRYSVLIYDVYPDGLVAGAFISESSVLTRIWQRQNRRFFSKALNIFTLTEGMAGTMSKYIDLPRIRIIQPWSLLSQDQKIEKKDNKFIKLHNLQDHFIVMYSGNIGLGHNVESLVEVAKILKDQEDLRFVIIGDGWNKQSVVKLISEYRLSNCLVLPFQPPEMFQYSLPAADLGVVSIAIEGARVCAPSKIYNLINTGIPLLAITEQPSEVANLIENFSIGASFRFDQVKEMAEFILLTSKEKDRLEKYKINLKACAGSFTSANAKEYLINFEL
jgi:glycosyltransferase involved in cell wall biosynthesis